MGVSEEARNLVRNLIDSIRLAEIDGHPHDQQEAALLAFIQRIERERDEARANYAFMVDRAAQREPTLDGYRELGAKCAHLEQGLDEARAENARLRHWLNTSMTYYDVIASMTYYDVIEGNERPMLQSVSKRIWYHATDNRESFPFAELIDAARKQ